MVEMLPNGAGNPTEPEHAPAGDALLRTCSPASANEKKTYLSEVSGN